MRVRNSYFYDDLLELLTIHVCTSHYIFYLDLDIYRYKLTYIKFSYDRHGVSSINLMGSCIFKN